MESTAAAEVKVAMPIDQVWSKMRDLSVAHYYVPGLTGCEITTQQRDGVGASRRVFQKGRPPMDETVVEWNEGNGFVIKLHSGDKPPPMFKQATFVYKIEQFGNETVFKPAMMYTMPWGAFGRLLDMLFLNKLFTGIVKKVAVSFKQYYETGAPSNPLFKG